MVTRLYQRLGRISAVQKVGGRMLRRGRANTAVQAVARRMLATSPHHVTPRDVAAGNVVSGAVNTLPVALVIMLGAEADTVASTVDRVAEVQRQTIGFRPVFVFDVPALAAPRRYRYPAELLVGEADWNQADQGGVSWTDYVTDRLGLIFETYGATASVTIGAEGMDEVARLTLTSLGPAIPQ